MGQSRLQDQLTQGSSSASKVSVATPDDETGEAPPTKKQRSKGSGAATPAKVKTWSTTKKDQADKILKKLTDGIASVDAKVQNCRDFPDDIGNKPIKRAELLKERAQGLLTRIRQSMEDNVFQQDDWDSLKPTVAELTATKLKLQGLIDAAAEDAEDIS